MNQDYMKTGNTIAKIQKILKYTKFSHFLAM